MTNDKIHADPRSLVPRVARLKAEGRTIVFGNGCFELLHVGHLRYLEGAKALGDVLVIAVNTDESMAMIKPGRPPVVPDYERMEMVAALEIVDFVVPLTERNPVELIKLLRPDVHTKGTDYDPETMPETPVVRGYGGRVAIVGDPKEHSTTEVLAALRERDGAGEP